MQLSLNQLFIYCFFFAPWAFLAPQLIANSSHRFASLATANILIASIYFLIFFLYLFFSAFNRTPLLIPRRAILSLSSIILFFLILGLFSNQAGHIAKDIAIVVMQLFFLILGYSLAGELSQERTVKIMVLSNLVIATALGAIVMARTSADIVSPMFGVQALALFGALSFKQRSFDLLFIATLLIGIVFWGFGKQSLLYSVLLITIWGVNLVSSGSQRQAKYRGVIYGAMGLLAIVLFLVLLNSIAGAGIEKKTATFFRNLDLYYISSGLSVDAVYLAFDDSTAGRVVEYVLIAEKMTVSPVFAIMGSGLGAALDLSIKNDYSSLVGFTFSDTQGVQTLPAFIFLKGGFLGCSLFVYSCRSIWSMRSHSSDLVLIIAALIFLSVLAFPTVVRFHFLMFFIGVALSKDRQSRVRGRVC